MAYLPECNESRFVFIGSTKQLNRNKETLMQNFLRLRSYAATLLLLAVCTFVGCKSSNAPSSTAKPSTGAAASTPTTEATKASPTNTAATKAPETASAPAAAVAKRPAPPVRIKAGKFDSIK